MALDDNLAGGEEKMEKTVQVVVNEFAGVRTARLAGLVENIQVEVYGAISRIASWPASRRRSPHVDDSALGCQHDRRD